MERMEHEIKQSREREIERHRVNELEKIVATLLQRMDIFQEEHKYSGMAARS
jgi:hypothetical protein